MLKKIIVILAIIIGILVPASAKAQGKSFYHLSWDVDIEIRENADFIVSETISYDFSGQYNQAYRTIPYNRFSSLSDWEVWEGNAKYVFSGTTELDKLDATNWG